MRKIYSYFQVRILNGENKVEHILCVEPKGLTLNEYVEELLGTIDTQTDGLVKFYVSKGVQTGDYIYADNIEIRIVNVYLDMVDGIVEKESASSKFIIKNKSKKSNWTTFSM